MTTYRLTGESYPINPCGNKSPCLLASYGAKCGVGLPTSYGANKSFLRIAEKVEKMEETETITKPIRLGHIGKSNAQRYKCIGNGWTVDVIAHILKGLKEQNK